MTLELLKKLISERIQVIDKPYQKGKYYDRCKEYITHNKMSKIEDFLEVDVQEFARLNLLINNDVMSEEECTRLLDSIIEYCKDLNYTNISNVADILTYVANCSQKDRIIECIKEPSERRFKKLLDQIDYDEIEITDELSPAVKEKKFRSLVGNLRKLQNDLDVITIVKHFNDFHNYALQDVFALLETRKKLEEDHENVEEQLKGYTGSYNAKIIKRARQDYYKMFYSAKNIIALHQVLVTYVMNEEQKDNKHNRDVQREKSGYQTALNELEKAMSQKEITNARAIVKTARNEEIKKAILEVIYAHNEKYYQSLEERLNQLRKNSINGYIALLKQKGIIVDTNEAKIMMHNSMDELEEIIQIITKLPLLEEEIKTILKTTNIQITRQIKDYIDKGYMTPAFVCDNLKLWDEKSTILKEIEAFYKEIQKWNMNPQIFYDSQEVLLDENHCVIKNMELLNQYGLMKSLKNTSNLSFLANPKMITNLDQIIESGLIEFLLKDIELLNSPYFDRLFLLREMHIEIDSLEELKEFLFTKRFIIPDESIDEYISDDSPFEEEFDTSIIELEQTRQNSWVYDIGGVFISSHKVERLRSQGKGIKEAILEGKKISREEFDRMKKILKKDSIKV